MLLSVIVWAIPSQGNAKRPIFKPFKKTIVLDPGHGGNDNGARGPNGALEKAVNLTLARMIAAGLKTDYRVVLTRTDDYQLDIPARTALANHEKAVIFISIHAGGSFLRQTNGMSVFYYKDTAESLPAPETEWTKQPDGGDSPIFWDTVQKRHITTSRKLAHLMQKYLIHPSTHKEGSVQGAALMLLKGADMPSILIETGYITNPVEENMLNNQDMIADIAQKIINGVIIFLNQSE